MNTLTQTQTEAATFFLAGLKTEFSINDYVNIEDIDFENAFESIQSQLDENNGFDIEIIYYSKAIQYLSENDNSLSESLEIASDMGFDIKNLTSEILASLLATQNAREEFYELESEINDFFNELIEEEEE